MRRTSSRSHSTTDTQVVNGPTTGSTRREFLQASAAACAAALLEKTASAAVEPYEDVLQWVDPRIGTGGHGHCFPGATVPFGAVQLSPDTFNSGWDWCSGYHISDTSIMGFSHTHLSGTGCGDLLDFLVMPGTGRAAIRMRVIAPASATRMR
jgi:putative alpha-1,2-mannosidase